MSGVAMGFIIWALLGAIIIIIRAQFSAYLIFRIGSYAGNNSAYGNIHHGDN